MIGLLIDFHHLKASLGCNISHLRSVVIKDSESNARTQAVGSAEVQINRLTTVDDFGDLPLNVLEVLAFDLFELFAEYFVLLGQLISFFGQLVNLGKISSLFGFSLLCELLTILLDLGDLVLALFLFLRVGDLGLFELLCEFVGSLALGLSGFGFLLNRRVVFGLEILFSFGLSVDL